MKQRILSGLFFGLIISSMLVSSCTERSKITAVPDWAIDAIWYQIFPDRFYNGDKSNDPTIETLEGTWPYDKQTEWAIMPWTSDWYKLQPWELKNARGFYYNAQLRRYGGDIQGIIDKLDYLQDLGVNSLYLNPIFESASSHKYGATMYHHIDNNFGPDPQGDILIWHREIAENPDTWEWTSADKLFLKLVDEVHKRDMKIIIDGVFNHVGLSFWAFEDVKKKGNASKFRDWFVIKAFDDPATLENEFEYQGWYDILDLPEVREDENGPCEGFRQHIHDVIRRWMDPNGDGDPSDGIDGWRLDVAEMVHKEFWRDFRVWVRDINPEAYLTGEVWWENFRDNIMFDTSPWLQGDIFDATMNYRFADAMLKAFVDQKNQILPSQLDSLLMFIRANYPENNQKVLQNLMASHDTERFASMMANPDRWIDHASNLNYDELFEIRKPTAEERKIQKTILVFQFCYLGAPYIYYGDEVGIWGADDPDCRKPMLWSEFNYEDERVHVFDLKRPIDKVAPDMELFAYYQKLCNMRNSYPSLRRGSLEIICADDEKALYGFERQYKDEVIRVLFNLSDRDCSIDFQNYFCNDKSSWCPLPISPRFDAKIRAKSFIIAQKMMN
ncbi:MAG: glycoside hydrolase family 13 protein [Candidatus Marinimicrobia bacterium]|nr:glycoside hydrolase family 13 protein [Candidatus Neomarinimicrobiota bacterium]